MLVVSNWDFMHWNILNIFLIYFLDLPVVHNQQTDAMTISEKKKRSMYFNPIAQSQQIYNNFYRASHAYLVKN